LTAEGIASPAKEEEAHAYLRMLWKPTKKVAFASRGSTLVIWYCSVKPDVPLKAKTAVTATVAELTIGKACLVAPDKTKPTAIYNDCFAQAALTKVNAYRKTHLGAPVELEITESVKLQTEMDAKDFTLKKASYVTLDGALITAKYQPVVLYEEKDKAVIKAGTLSQLKPDVIKTWYSYSALWDYANASVLKGEDKTKALKFAHMIARGATKVVLGVNNKYVIAYFLYDKAPLDKNDVMPACIENNYNTCYNKIAIEHVNKYRLMHKMYT